MSSSIFFQGEDKTLFDKEYVTKPIVFLKGIGRYCEVNGCHKHIFGYSNKRFCSNKCRWKNRELTRRKTGKDIIGLHCFASLKKYGIKKPYRIMKIYLKKGVIEEVRITPESKELWKLLEKIADFRDISKPMEVIQ